MFLSGLKVQKYAGITIYGNRCIQLTVFLASELHQQEILVFIALLLHYLYKKNKKLHHCYVVY